MNYEAGTTEEIRDSIEKKLARYFGTSPEEATENQIYKATVLCVRDMLTHKREGFKAAVKRQRAKRVYYLCMEFLVGPSLRSNLYNLGMYEQYKTALEAMGYSLEKLIGDEPDPGLGNGGLGRLAACYMDSLTTLSYPATGFSILYEYGLFSQKIIDGNQIELPDEWMKDGDSWLVARPDRAFCVKLGGHIRESWDSGRLEIIHDDAQEVRAVPYDMLISGAQSGAVNTLRLWRAYDTRNINMSLFSQGQYVRAMQESSGAEIISKVLYPSDNHTEGKLLRLTQQYFLVSASLQSIISDHLTAYGTLYNFPDKVAIHINDTHPALVIPELMRILMDIYSYSWESAWAVVSECVSYTNHTVMPEALECWDAGLFSLKLPRIYMIVEEINRRLCADLWNLYPGDWDRISRMAVVAASKIRMANMSVAASHTVNGVSRLHTEILKKTVFHDYYKAMPDKFINVTNGIAHRRWLCCANVPLTELLDGTIGDGYKCRPESLSEFAKYKDDAAVLDSLARIKQENKEAFARHLYNKTGRLVDTSSVFDVQVKRIHEYKRQLMNALKIIAYYNELCENPNADITPCTFIFGGKAAPGYLMAKEIIKLIWSLGEQIRKTPRVRDIINVVYLEDYNVSTAEILIPASDISEQISLAGKEASGTGCMKFMINGALTIGTLDGANVEMKEAVGDDNIYIFGLSADEADDLWKSGYDSTAYYRKSERLKGAVDGLSRGFNSKSFSGITDYLLYGCGVSDPYMCLADFDSYFAEGEKLRRDRKNAELWNKKSLLNIAAAGHFSSDRSIEQYAQKIWRLDKVDFDDTRI